MRGEVKTPGGKLVGVDVDVDDTGRVQRCTLDGDFFAEGDEVRVRALIAAIGGALARGWNSWVGQGTCADSSADVRTELGVAVAQACHEFPDVHLVGTDPQAIALAFVRALAAGDAANIGSVIGSGGRGTGGVSHGGRRTSTNAFGETGHTAVDGKARSRMSVEERRARWRTLHPRVVVDGPRSPAEQMRVDRDWAQRVAAGTMPATLRFWSWSAPAIVVGRYQSIPDEVDEHAAAREGFAVVRRCTGGGVMFARPEDVITYSLYAPRGFVEGLDVADSYRLCDQWVIDALQGIGLKVGFGGLNDLVSPEGKVGGAAQRRFASIDGGPGAVLHHDMLAYRIDAAAMGRVLRVSQEKMSDKAVKSAQRRVDPLCSQTSLSRQKIVDRLIISARRAI